MQPAHQGVSSATQEASTPSSLSHSTKNFFKMGPLVSDWIEQQHSVRKLMAVYRAPLRSKNYVTTTFTDQDRCDLHEVAQTILNASLPPNSVVYLDICQQMSGSNDPATIDIDCSRVPVDHDYQLLVAQAIIDAFPIHGYAGPCEENGRLYKALYQTPATRNSQQRIEDLAATQKLIGEDHPLMAAITSRHTRH
jgi:hypothetical protein